MISISTHVLDTAGGLPAEGVAVVVTDSTGVRRGSGMTDNHGRIADLANELSPGSYTLRFDLADRFISSVAITVQLVELRHYHLPLLTSGGSALAYLGT